MNPSIQDLWNLPVNPPQGAANPFTWAWITPPTTSSVPAPTSGGVTAWLKDNSTAVIVIAGALFVLALAGGRR